jgi:hypothetical protein
MATAPINVTHGFTLKSRWLTAAILHQRKPFENCSQEWKPGWYAVHTGVNEEPASDAWAEQHVRDGCEDDADVALIAADVNDGLVCKGFIAGLCHVSHCLPPESCAGSKWALGPVCMVIDQTLFLQDPVAHTGQLGTWPISLAVRCAIQQQVGRCAIRCEGTVLAKYPLDASALVRMRDQRRAEKRKSCSKSSDKDVKQSKPGFDCR